MKIQKILLILIAIAIILFAGCSSPTDILDSPTSTDIIKESTTTENGIATFIDNQTGEDINIYIENKSHDKLPGINVTFWDGENYELFILDDPTKQYSSNFEIYPHNSDHTITMYITGDSLSDTVENIEISSLKEQATENFFETNKDKSIYIGRFTPDQIDEVTTAKLNIITPLVGGCYKKFASHLSDFIDIVGEIYEINEPKFYDVYILTPGGITSSIRWLEPVEEVYEIFPQTWYCISPWDETGNSFYFLKVYEVEENVFTMESGYGINIDSNEDGILDYTEWTSWDTFYTITVLSRDSKNSSAYRAFWVSNYEEFYAKMAFSSFDYYEFIIYTDETFNTVDSPIFKNYISWEEAGALNSWNIEEITTSARSIIIMPTFQYPLIKN